MDVNMKLKLLSEERDGPILRCLYACPCGQGTVEEEQDYTEGHRDCWHHLNVVSVAIIIRLYLVIAD